MRDTVGSLAGFFDLANGALPRAVSIATAFAVSAAGAAFGGDSTFIETRRGSIASVDPRRQPWEKKGQC
jgi:hypothetical protein